MPRLFVAIDAPESVQQELADLQGGVEGVRWTNPEQFHLTLRFLGDVEEDRVPEIKTALEQVDVQHPVTVQPEGVTAFPNRRNASVLIVALERSAPLMALYEQIEAAVQQVGFAPEDRSFRPHITFGRVKDASSRAVHEYLRSQHPPTFQFRAREFLLYKSELSSDGATHSIISRFAL